MEHIIWLRNVRSNYDGYNLLTSCWNIISNSNEKYILLDFSKAKTFDSNLLAPLMVIVEMSHASGKTIMAENIPNELKAKLPLFAANYSNNIKKKKLLSYKAFPVNALPLFIDYVRDEFWIEEFASKVSKSLQGIINASLGEVFGNVLMHTDASQVFCCGQIKRSGRLDFTIANIARSGTTIQENVLSYFAYNKLIPPANTIEWAIEEGNSTKLNKTGGLGLFILRDFIDRNSGKLQIISGWEYYERNNFKSGTNRLKHFFPGTIVNIEFNILDKNNYTEGNMISADGIF